MVRSLFTGQKPPINPMNLTPDRACWWSLVAQAPKPGMAFTDVELNFGSFTLPGGKGDIILTHRVSMRADNALILAHDICQRLRVDPATLADIGEPTRNKQ